MPRILPGVGPQDLGEARPVLLGQDPPESDDHLHKEPHPGAFDDVAEGLKRIAALDPAAYFQLLHMLGGEVIENRLQQVLAGAHLVLGKAALEVEEGGPAEGSLSHTAAIPRARMVRRSKSM